MLLLLALVAQDSALDADDAADKMAHMMSLHKSTKGSDDRGAHYHAMYAQLLSQYRTRPDVSLLEIGVQYGGSMHLWASYFRSIKRIDGIRWGVKPGPRR
ncbi:hypothetical protein EMIHUDRAFT_215114 [Emiliania huxleyi CCMP1516]|uniref:Methyltransferase n=2 Tax=Emiliania huxleyi TaxID=2903 RepID=A0A0D3IHY3_EMIH1|nr:hypothetical protein EMIHUDRAFT_215114 [Emiliania huxleyi CCMP1516]EOD10868.1 hypothetical protein EMIHUDRAFT_215114 [Emiliania huxleyi CCMP1516]|eukprot:XP_005763297.1 hypothetical protein EMIHUDRAFT_215114 [Emiliania huxleyi CCMP1516]